MTTAKFESRIAHLSESDRDDYDYVVHGVAHGEEELTRGLNGPKYWPADEVERAAASLEGQPVYRTHGDDREEIGAVLRAAYEPGVGVVYEAGLEDAAIAEELSLGQREVSVEAGNPSEVERHEETGAAILRGYEYTALTTPEDGASPGNYTAPGSADENPALAALSAGAIETALDEDADLAGMGNLEEIEEGDIVSWRTGNGTLAYGEVRGTIATGKYHDEIDADRVVTAPAALIAVHRPLGADEWEETGRLVARKPASLTVRDGFPAAPASEAQLADWETAAGVRFRGTRNGKLDKSEIPDPPEHEDHYLYPGETKDESEYPVVDGDGYLRRGNVESAWKPGGQGASVSEETHDEKVLKLNRQFENPPIETSENAQSDDAADAAEALGDGDTQETNTDSATMSDPNDPENGDDPDVEALLQRVDEKEERIETLEAELEEKESELEETEAELEEKTEEVESAKRAYAARLAEHSSVLDEDDYVERFDIAELREKFDDLDEELAAMDSDGSGEPTVRSGSSGTSGSETANLSDAEKERIEEKEARLAELEGKDGMMAEKERERLENEIEEIKGGA